MDTAINKMSQFVLYCTLDELKCLYTALKFRVENTPMGDQVNSNFETSLMTSIEQLHPAIK